MNQKSPIFVVGAPRSGTTLITEMLSRHPNIFIYNETLLYDFVIARDFDRISSEDFKEQIYSHLSSRIDARIIKDEDNKLDFGCKFTPAEGDSIKSDFHLKLSRLKEDCKYSDVFSLFMEIVSKRRGRGRWGDKTPNHVFHLNRIFSDFPDAKIVHIIRDPRAFVRSYKFAWRQRGAKEGTRKLYHPLVTANLWLRSTHAFQRFKATQNTNSYIEIRYEDLVKDPESSLRHICKFLEESFDNNMVGIQGANSSFSKTREVLSDWETAICERVCRTPMREYGYALSKSSLFGAIAIGISILSLPWFLFQASPVVLKQFKGGIWRYLNARGLLSS